MKLSQEAVDNLLHIIADFDRERGVPHDYVDLEVAFKEIEFDYEVVDYPDGSVRTIHLIISKKS